MLRLGLLLVALISVDAAVLEALTMNSTWPAPVARLFSLGGGLACAALLSRFLPAPLPRKPRPGLRPLIVVDLLLNYGIFAMLASRTAGIQPLIHLAAAWLGAALFLGFGLWRIRRWRPET